MQVLITKDTAKLAKELGFNDAHTDFYIDKKKNGDLTDLPAVPQSLLQKWLREKHNIQMFMKPFYDSKEKKTTFACDVTKIKQTGNVSINVKSQRCDTYEDALEEGLINGLSLVKNQ